MAPSGGGRRFAILSFVGTTLILVFVPPTPDRFAPRRNATNGPPTVALSSPADHTRDSRDARLTVNQAGPRALGGVRQPMAALKDSAMSGSPEAPAQTLTARALPGVPASDRGSGSIADVTSTDVASTGVADSGVASGGVGSGAAESLLSGSGLGSFLDAGTLAGRGNGGSGTPAGMSGIGAGPIGGGGGSGGRGAPSSGPLSAPPPGPASDTSGQTATERRRGSGEHPPSGSAVGPTGPLTPPSPAPGVRESGGATPPGSPAPPTTTAYVPSGPITSTDTDGYGMPGKDVILPGTFSPGHSPGSALYGSLTLLDTSYLIMEIAGRNP